MILEDALAGKHGDEMREAAEQAVGAVADQLVRMIGDGTLIGDPEKFANGGFIKPGTTFSIDAGNEFILPKHYSVGFHAELLRRMPSAGPGIHDVMELENEKGTD